MKLVPCIFCDAEVESDNDKVIAKVCEDCLKFDDLTTILKKVDLKKLKEVLNKKIILTKDGELI